MSDGAPRWADVVRKKIAAAQAARDELRVQAHLARMKARVRFAEVERRFEREQSVARNNLKRLVAALEGREVSSSDQE